MAPMRVTSQAFLKDDLENILLAIARTARSAIAGQYPRRSTEYAQGFADALLAVATATGIAPDHWPDRNTPEQPRLVFPR